MYKPLTVNGEGFLGEMRIQFTKSPTGLFNLGYDAGNVADLPDVQAMEVVAAGFGVIVAQPEKSIEQLKAELTIKGKSFPENASKKTLEKLNGS
jgi:hypothetical protein